MYLKFLKPAAHHFSIPLRHMSEECGQHSAATFGRAHTTLEKRTRHHQCVHELWRFLCQQKGSTASFSRGAALSPSQVPISKSQRKQSTKQENQKRFTSSQSNQL